MHAFLFGPFLDQHRVARKEVETASLRVYSELIVRAGDTNERVSDRAEEAIQVSAKHSSPINCGEKTPA